MTGSDPDPDDATHVVETNHGSPQSTPVTWVRAANAVVSAAIETGQTVYITVEETTLETYDESALASLRDLDTAETDGELLTAAVTEQERTALAPTLALGADDDGDVTGWRGRGLRRLTTVEDGIWRFHAAPAESIQRLVHDPSESFRTELRANLDRVPATALFSAEDPETVGDDGAYAVGPHSISAAPTNIDRTYRYSNLAGVIVDPERRRIGLEWDGPRSQASTSLGRVTRALVQRLRGAPPEWLAPEEDGTFARILDRLHEARTQLDYRFDGVGLAPEDRP